MPCTKSKTLSGVRPSSASTVSMIFAVSVLREAALAQEFAAVLVGAGDDLLPRRLDAVDEGHGRGIGETGQRRGRFMGEARGGVFGVADGDLLEILDAPEIAVLADGAEIEARDAERLGADLGIPAIEAAEVEIGRAVGQPAGLDRIEIVDQEQEDVAVGGIERRRVLRDVDARIVDAGRPVEHAGHLPARVAGAVAGDALHGRDQLVVVDAAVVGPGDGAQFDAAVFDLQRLDLFGAMGGQAILQIDAGQRRRKLAQIGGRRADQAGELAEAPMGRRDRRVRAGQRSAPGARHRRGSPPPGSPRSRRFGSGCARSGRARRRSSSDKRQIALVGRPRKPFRGHAADPLAAAHIHLVAAASHRERRPELQPGSWDISMTGAGGLSSSPQPVTEAGPPSHSKRALRGSPQKGCGGDRGADPGGRLLKD